LVGHRGQVHALAFAEDGLTLVTGGRDDAIHIWNPESGELVTSLDSASAGLSALAYARDGSIVAAHWRRLGQVWIYEGPTGALIAQIPVKDAASLAISPDNTRLLVASPSGLEIWDLAELQVVAQCGGTANRTWEARYNQSGDLILATGPIPRTYDPETLVARDPLYARALHAFDVAYCLDLSEEHDRVVLGWGHSEGRDAGSLRVLSWPDREVIQVMRGHHPAVGSVCFAPGGRHVVSLGSRDSLIRVWQVQSGRVLQELHEPGAAVVRFSPTGVFMVSAATPPRSLVVWEWSP
jgi:WD40 repeat protein